MTSTGETTFWSYVCVITARFLRTTCKVQPEPPSSLAGTRGAVRTWLSHSRILLRARMGAGQRTFQTLQARNVLCGVDMGPGLQHGRRSLLTYLLRRSNSGSSWGLLIALILVVSCLLLHAS
ncbi:uncharacterized protein BO95DRAFT_130034 [Aspergillus brunneoviolaceus CBS 621.78]|uniref:Uncharacterized protein n=1 Tax=Aspergillus brunneoviolaceus CBS 621.78 TaxID=1450534 RepID=A0ACD1G9B8_9EURO|nr:hypothetical protein BO95DRAFT_130034 [Aspergillus brunneoviolaceus CBS 621.78]RAH45849.1 hypothetical protein BO95DRAFT_130034 [Aspergillus brunneoviolaceus CBS 621.78]